MRRPIWTFLGRSAAALAAAALVLITAAPSQAGKRDYVDKRYGYEIKLPYKGGWSQTPLQPGATVEVAKFKDDRDGDFSTLSIYRFEKTSLDQTTPGDEASEPEPMPRFPRGGRQEPGNAKDYFAYILQWRYKQCGLEWTGMPEPKKVKYGRVLGSLYTIELENKRWGGGKFGMLAGIISNDAEEYLILFLHKNKLKKMIVPWSKSIRSFRFPDDDTPVGEEDQEDIDDRGKATAAEDELLDPEKRAKIKRGLVGSWKFIDTPHYIIVYNCDERLAKHIAKRVEYMRTVAFESVFPPVAPIEECMVVRVCKEMDEYYHYGGPRGSAGYWASFHDELVFPDLSRSKKPDEQTIGVLNHEAFHQYVYYALLKHNPPVWFNEGYAEYFFCVNSTRKTLKFEKRHQMRYSVIKSALGMGKLIPTKEFIKLSHGQYMQRASLCYAQGWAFATWLKNVTKNKRYKQIPDIFFLELQKGYEEMGAQGRMFPGAGRERGPAVEKAMEKAFEGIDLEQLHKDFEKDLKRRM